VFRATGAVIFATRSDGSRQTAAIDAEQICADSVVLHPGWKAVGVHRAGFEKPHQPIGDRADRERRSEAAGGKAGGFRASAIQPGTPEFLPRSPTFSPDGRWLAYGSFESGFQQVYVRAFRTKAASGKFPTTAANIRCGRGATCFSRLRTGTSWRQRIREGRFIPGRQTAAMVREDHRGLFLHHQERGFSRPMASAWWCCCPLRHQGSARGAETTSSSSKISSTNCGAECRWESSVTHR